LLQLKKQKTKNLSFIFFEKRKFKPILQLIHYLDYCIEKTKKNHRQFRDNNYFAKQREKACLVFLLC